MAIEYFYSRKYGWLCWTILLMLCMFTGFSMCATYYVDADNGSDANDGSSLEKAWLTLAHAQSELQGTAAADTLYVYGDHRLTSTWALTATDTRTSGTVLTLIGVNDAKILGSVSYAGNLFASGYPSAGSDVNYYDVGENSFGSVPFVTVNYKWMDIAREPDRVYGDLEAGHFFAALDTPDSSTQLKHKVGDVDPTTWSQLGAVDILAYGGNYRNSRLNIQSYNAGTDTWTLGGTTYANPDPNDMYYVYNVIELLDEPNEFFWDSGADTLYIYPPSTADPLDSGDVIGIPLVDYLVTIDDCDYWTFQSLWFGECTNEILGIDTSDNITFTDCTFTASGDMGIEIIDCMNMTIADCNLYDFRAEAIWAYDTSADLKNLIDHNMVITTCNIHDTALQQIGPLAAIWLSTTGTDVKKNVFDQIPDTAVMVDDGTSYLIELNYMTNIGQIRDDGSAGVYFTGRHPVWGRGSIVRYNYIDANGIGHGHKSTSPYNYAREYDQGYGIYLDDAAAGVQIYGNVIMYGSPANILIHGGPDVDITNNILIACQGNSGHRQIEWGDMSSTNLAQYMGYLTQIEGSTDGWTYGTITTAFPDILDIDPAMNVRDLFRENTFYRNHIIYPDINTKYYKIRHVDANNSDWDYNFYYPGSTGSTTVDYAYISPTMTFAQWQALGFDDHSVNINTIQLAGHEDEYTLFFNSDTDANAVQDLGAFSWMDANEDPVTSLTLLPMRGVILYKTEPPEQDLVAARWYQPITIDKDQVGTGGITNFSFLIKDDLVTDGVVDPNGSYTAQEDGGDIRFTDGPDLYDSNQLACSIISFGYDSGTGNNDAGIQIRVMIPTLPDDANTVIYMWYNTAGTSTQPAASDTYGSNNAVRADLEAFYTFEEDPNGSAPELTDYSKNTNTGTNYGTMLTEDRVTGQVGNAWAYDGLDDYTDCGAGVSNDTFTLSLWVKSAPDEYWCGLTSAVIAGTQPAVKGWDADELIWYANGGNFVKFTYVLTSAAWHHVVLINPNAAAVGEATMYVDGVSLDQSELAEGAMTAVEGIVLGARASLTYGECSLDEFKFYNEILTPAWVTTEYNNTKSPSTFATAGTPEQVGGTPSGNPQIIIIIITGSLPLLILWRRKK